MPVFTPEEQKEIAGSYDFFGINAYTTRIVVPQDRGDWPSYENDRDSVEVIVNTFGLKTACNAFC